VAALCGVGFTMSLFIGGLAFEHVGGDAAAYLTSHRIGILSGSLIAGISGYLILKFAPSKPSMIVETDKIVDKEPPAASQG
jgi:NhaA family Na+:H+ antiporter